MKFLSEQSARNWSEVAEFFHTMLIGISGGALFSHWFDNVTVGLMAMTLSFVFSFLNIKNLKKRAKERTAKFDDQLDALRYRGLYPPDGTGSDDDVKRL